jgi:RNA recognition motif-containing protein
MTKLFVGNLADSVDSHRLKNLFLQHVNVQECDVLKNFAFVHVATEEDATIVIDKLDKTLLEGREIHIERSTSRLRREPGMENKCFTCGANDHKTPQCPQEQGRRKTVKRPGEGNESVSAAKKPNANLTPTPATPQCWGYKVTPVIDNDPELPCPANPELKTLYDQYKDSRSRYHYFRDRLQKELSLQAANGVQPGSGPVRIDLTRTVQPSQPVIASVPNVQNITPVSSAQAYRPQNYPGATPTVSYPGAQATVYSVQPSAYGQPPIQHYSTPSYTSNKTDSVKAYSSTPTYQRPSTFK